MDDERSCEVGSLGKAAEAAVLVAAMDPTAPGALGATEAVDALHALGGRERGAAGVRCGSARLIAVVADREGGAASSSSSNEPAVGMAAAHARVEEKCRAAFGRRAASLACFAAASMVCIFAVDPANPGGIDC